MKIKSSSSLPPDAHSLKQAILRAHWQTCYWLRCTEQSVESLSFEGCGWKWSSEVSSLKAMGQISKVTVKTPLFQRNARDIKRYQTETDS